MRARCRALDWAATALGLVEAWPPALRSTVRLSLDAAVASAVFASARSAVGRLHDDHGSRG